MSDTASDDCLMQELINACVPTGFPQMIGYIDADNAASLAIHEKSGFYDVGCLLVAQSGQRSLLVNVRFRRIGGHVILSFCEYTLGAAIAMRVEPEQGQGRRAS
jgi:hypothetical protein